MCFEVILGYAHGGIASTVGLTIYSAYAKPLREKCDVILTY